MKQESSNFSKVVQEDNSKRALNQAPICSASDGVKKDIVINSAAPLSMGIVPTAQLITLQLNNVYVSFNLSNRRSASFCISE